MNVKKLQLPLQTASLTTGFAVWVILSSLMPFIKEDLVLSASQIAWVTAIPVLLGSILRIPIGYWTNRFGARIIFTLSFAFLLLPVIWIGYFANSFTGLALGGFFLGIGGAVFSVGVTSIPKYYPKERHGSVNGIYGIGNLGTAVTTFSAPVAAKAIGWNQTVILYCVLLGIFVLLNFIFGDKEEPKVKTSLSAQIKGIYKSDKLWFICLFYFITFGSFVAFTVYLPNFLVSHFGLEKVDAGLRTAGFIALATLMRPVGGWLGDRYNPFRILMLVFAGLTLSGILLSFAPSFELYTAGCLTVAICAGLGNGTIFKLVPLYFSKQAGIANGLISAMGGLGGFFPPLILTILFSLTGHYAIGFMALSQFALASLIIVVWMFYQEKVAMYETIVKTTKQGTMITNPQGIIVAINDSFTEVTGYSKDEVIGKNPSILKSGRQDGKFYESMWESLLSKGHWQGEIWNKKKNGDLYLEWLTISTVTNDAGEVQYYSAMFSDLTSYQLSREKEVS